MMFWLLYLIVGVLSAAMLLIATTTWWLNLGPSSVSRRAGDPLTGAEKFKLFNRFCCPDCDGELRRRRSGDEAIHSMIDLLNAASFYCTDCAAEFSYEQPECRGHGHCSEACVGRFVRGTDRRSELPTASRGKHDHAHLDCTAGAAAS